MSQSKAVSTRDDEGEPTPAARAGSAWPLWLRAVLFSVGYFVCAEASTQLSAQTRTVTSFWLPSGLYVATLLLNETKAWPWLVLAGFPANLAFDLLQGNSIWLIIGFYCANTVGAVLGAELVRRFVAFRPTFATVKEFAGFLAYAGVLSPAAGATVAASVLTVLGFSDSFVTSWRIYCGSTGMAILILSPFILTWASPSTLKRLRALQPTRLIEASLLCVGLVGATWSIMTFGGGITSPNKSPLLIFLLWAALRFGLRGATLANLALSLLVGLMTSQFLRGLSPGEFLANEYVTTMQTALAIGGLVGLVPAIVLAERNHTLEELRRSEERFELAVRGSSDGLWDWNILTNEVFYSDRYRDLLGYSPGEFPNVFASFEAHLHPDDEDRVLRAIDAHLKQRVPHDVEFRLQSRSGEFRWIRGRGQAVWDEQGRPVRMAGSITDVTAARQSREALRESEEKFSKAFRSGPNGIAITEMATGRYLEVNESFCQLYGYTQEEMVGRTSLELGVFESPEDRERLVQSVHLGGHLRNFELRSRKRTGERLTLLTSAERIELAGKACLVVVLFDITARLDAEERLEKSRLQLRALSARLQSLREEERTHLAREIHDHLGQLLTALSLDLRLIERRASHVADLDLQTALSGKIMSARMLADETISSVQKIAAELRPAILDRIGLEAALEVEAQAFQTRTGVTCELKLPASAVEATPEQATAIFRVFQEILTNIARHAQATEVTVQLVQQAGQLSLRVTDDGIGIQDADLDDPNSLGILGMRERAQMLGGGIRFDRDAEKGTSVTVSIPLHVPEATEAAVAL